MNPKKIYDAIVVGSGAAGGMAAKELTEGGLSGYAPTLTIGALAARASDYIVEQQKRRAL